LRRVSLSRSSLAPSRATASASPGESIAAYSARLDGTDIDRAQAAVGATRTAQFPLVEDWHPTPSLATPSPTAPLSSSQRTDN